LEERTKEGSIPRKHFLSIRGYLVYVSMTYPSIEPYMKGIHLTAESWRKNRDVEGWRFEASEARLLTLNDETGKYIMEGDEGDNPGGGGGDLLQVSNPFPA
jgi:hypothetical protein